MCMTILMSSSQSSKVNDESKKVQKLSKEFKESHEMDYWVRTQKEQWPGSEVDKVIVGRGKLPEKITKC